MPDNHNDLFGSLKGVPKACSEVCGCKKNRKCMWWWNNGVKDEIQKGKKAYKAMGKILLKK